MQKQLNVLQIKRLIQSNETEWMFAVCHFKQNNTSIASQSKKKLSTNKK